MSHKQRSREEIDGDGAFDPYSINSRLLLEVLLDIRDLLQPVGKEKQEYYFGGKKFVRGEEEVKESMHVHDFRFSDRYPDGICVSCNLSLVDYPTPPTPSIPEKLEYQEEDLINTFDAGRSVPLKMPASRWKIHETINSIIDYLKANHKEK
jgi:hypothetical protein